MRKISVIPEPVFFEVLGDTSVFTLNDSLYFEGTDETEGCRDELLSFIRDIFCFEPLSAGKEKIRMEITGEGASEGYSLKVEKDRILLTGNDEKGLFYAVQTLKQLLFQSEGSLPEIVIEDYPRFSVRGFMLDCGRYFFTVDAVKQFIDMMAFHKLNEFHWHLSEDQGFRCCLESKLLLTEIGSYRSHTNFNTRPHEGYYTKADMLDVINYAHSKHIKVIPEIDTPGHVKAMLSAYPGLACFPQDFLVSSFWGVKHDVLCIGKESTFAFIEELYDELTEIFTDGIIHLGGDEVPTVRWSLCRECQKRMKEEGMKDVSELHTYYLDRVASYLREKGIEVRMWNDTVKEKMVDRSLTWQLWHGGMKPEDAVKELNGGRKFVISCSENYYLDLPYSLTSIEKCYSLEPEFDGLTDEGKKNLLGVEACLWTEFVPDMLTADKMTYPRLGAICESAWSQKEKKDYTYFCTKLDSYCALLGQLGVKDATIVAALGSVGVGIGLALQGGAANFAGGVLILFLKPFKVGDFIVEVNENNQGTVVAIGMFYTVLAGKGDRKIVIPNSKLTDASVINLTASGFWLCDITVGISYSDDIDKARRIMISQAENDYRVLKDKEIMVLLAELGESAVKLELRCWTSIDDHWQTLWDLTENIKKAFDENDITIAFNQLDVHIEKP